MIRNEASYHDKHIDDLRAAIEHRATWFYFMLKAASDKGLKADDFAREAIYNCGIFHADTKFPNTDDLKEFAQTFGTENVRKIFEWETSLVDNELRVVFHYCPLVAAWQKLTDDESLIAHMCDIAMDGDRGIVSTYKNFEFELGDTIAQGCPTCHLTVRKRNKDETDR
ncbi:MAG: L-2-amino-thiazoline-4-carboxylic acid hydrolase [Christensenellales bacterium]|jgi:hypothetical protein